MECEEMEIAGTKNIPYVSHSDLSRQIDVEVQKRKLHERRKEADERREQFIYEIRHTSNHIDKVA